MIQYSDNDGYVQVTLTNATDGSVATGGTLVLTSLKDGAGTAVAGTTFPIAMPEVAATGVYRGVLPMPDLTLDGDEIPAGSYIATVDGTVAGTRYHETGKIQVKERKSSA